VLAGLIDGTLEIGLACAVSGILVGVILVAGLGIELSNVVVHIGRSSMLLALIAAMSVVMLVGMAVPGIEAYIIAASVCAAPLAELGVPLLAAHMFIFYFSLFAGLTQPVALTAFAAAGIAGSDPFRTGFLAAAIAAPAYLLAYFMVLQPQLLLLDGTTTQIAPEHAAFIRTQRAPLVRSLLSVPDSSVNRPTHAKACGARRNRRSGNGLHGWHH
jgi:TRAP-type uncharacterized transport system fused permease subunit